MKKILRKIGAFGYYVISPIVNPINLLKVIPRYVVFWAEFIKYKSAKPLKDSINNKLVDIYPILTDKTTDTQFDAQYFYQGVWAFRKIINSRVEKHVDVGSQIDLIGFLTAVTKVEFVDIRPLQVKLDNFKSIKGSILDLPFENNSIKSLSCLHVAEHIGLGRYGDPLNPSGTKEACLELSRVLANGGDLYFSLPIGRPRACFNAHRVHSISQILGYFKGLHLEELIVVDDKGQLVENANIDDFDNAVYSGGLFHFKK